MLTCKISNRWESHSDFHIVFSIHKEACLLMWAWERNELEEWKQKWRPINYCCFSIHIVKYDHCLTRPNQVVVKRHDDAWGCTGMHMLPLIALYSQELTKDTQKKMLLGIISILIWHPTITNGKLLPSASLNFRISFIFFFVISCIDFFSGLLKSVVSTKTYNINRQRSKLWLC